MRKKSTKFFLATLFLSGFFYSSRMEAMEKVESDTLITVFRLNEISNNGCSTPSWEDIGEYKKLSEIPTFDKSEVYKLSYLVYKVHDNIKVIESESVFYKGGAEGNNFSASKDGSDNNNECSDLVFSNSINLLKIKKIAQEVQLFDMSLKLISDWKEVDEVDLSILPVSGVHMVAIRVDNTVCSTLVSIVH